MILLLGASGYLGSAFAGALGERGWAFRGLSRAEVDYTRFETLLDLLHRERPAFLINAAGFTGQPNVDACETARAETLAGNTLLPLTIAHACQVARVPWGHVSSGCIYSGAKVRLAGQLCIEKDLTLPELRALLEAEPEALQGYTEDDPPNFSFRAPPCSFYSGTKALAEEALAGAPQVYLWRLRIPFDELDHPKNYLTKLLRYPRIYDNANSISHRGDFARACLDLWERRAPFGTYHITNPGFVTTRQVVRMIEATLRPPRKFEFWANDDEFYRHAAGTPRSNCILETAKLAAAGVRLRPVHEAIQDAMDRWKAQPSL
jgi:dTDP-4-dehydrorhamnose reductase